LAARHWVDKKVGWVLRKHLPRGVFLVISAPSAGIAQLVEHLICNQRVASSNLAAGTIFPIIFQGYDFFEITYQKLKPFSWKGISTNLLMDITDFNL
jgi:hypothetical protein